MERVTLKSVAKEAGFSVTTVSRVLGGADYPISPEARECITKTANRLGYVPNLLARSLKTRVSQEVALVVPTITNPFFTSVILGAEAALAKRGYNMLFYMTSTYPDRDSELLTSIRSKMIAGVIIAADCITREMVEPLRQMRASGVPVIVVDYATPLMDSPLGVFFDYYAGGQTAAQYLIAKGHRRVAFATRALDKISRRSRKDGFVDAMSKAKAEFSERDVFISYQADEFQSGVELANEILESAVPYTYTAIAASNDATAVGVITGLRARGVRVPQEISVLGFDDCMFSMMASPLLTTIHVPSQDMGAMAAQLILEQINGQQTLYSIQMKPKLIERDSVQSI